MAPEKIVYMSNQIATAFAHLSDEAAIRAIAEHVDAFWDPRMRAKLLERAAANDPALDPRVIAAAGRVRRPQAA